MAEISNRLALVVVGMCGVGKSLVSEYLKTNGWQYLRFGQVTIDEIEMEILPFLEKTLDDVYKLGKLLEKRIS